MTLKPIYPPSIVVLRTKRMVLRLFENDGGYFLEGESGEGLTLHSEDLDAMLHDYFEKNF